MRFFKVWLPRSVRIFHFLSLKLDIDWIVIYYISVRGETSYFCRFDEVTMNKSLWNEIPLAICIYPLYLVCSVFHPCLRIQSFIQSEQSVGCWGRNLEHNSERICSHTYLRKDKSTAMQTSIGTVIKSRLGILWKQTENYDPPFFIHILGNLHFSKGDFRRVPGNQTLSKPCLEVNIAWRVRWRRDWADP